MKKILLALMTVFAMLAVSCSKDPEPTSNLPEYTLMMYAAGGGLDSLMVKTFDDLKVVGASSKLKITVQCKLSEDYQGSTDARYAPYKGVVRFVQPGAGEQPKIETIGNASRDFSTKQSLREFIEWSKSQCPAKHYFLVLWGHGNGWSYDEDCSKACISDDNGGKDVWIKDVDVVKAIQEAGVHFRVVDFFCCSMARLENIYEYQGVADYLRVSNEPITATGEEAKILTNLLRLGLDSGVTDSDLYVESVWYAYLESLKIGWESVFPTIQVSSVFLDTRDMDAFTTNVKTFVQMLTLYYSKFKTEIDAATSSCYRCFESDKIDDPTGNRAYDIVDYARLVSEKVMEKSTTEGKQFQGIYQLLKQSCNKMEVIRVENEQRKKAYPALDELSYGVLLTDKTDFEKYQGPSYSTLVFNNKTGWSEWLKMNEAFPKGNPIPFVVPE